MLIIILILLFNVVFFYYFSEFFMGILILMEFMVLNLMLIYMLFSFGPFYFLIYFLVLGVCDGVLGLLILVLLFRFYGLDLVKWSNMVM